MDRTDKACLALLTIALLAAISLAVGRLRIESRNRVVEIIVDADDVRRVAAASSVSVPALLRELRSAGASAVGVQEETLEELVQDGRVTIGAAKGEPTLSASTPEAAAGLAEALRRKFPGAKVAYVRGESAVGLGRLTPQLLWEAPLLLASEEIAAAHTAGLRVVARLGNYPSATGAAIEAAAAAAAEAGAALVVFRGDQVLGYREMLPETARAFARHGLQYGFVEIAEQKGEDGLAQRLASRLIRVHSITDADLENISASTAIARYARAVRERGIRACYVRLLPGSQADPAAENRAYVSAVVTGLRQEGFRVGPPAPLSAPAGWPSRPAQWLVAIGIAAGLALLLRRLAPVGQDLRWAVVIAGSVGLVALTLKGQAWFAPVGGLVAASVFPALGLAWALQYAQERDGGTREGLGRALAGLGIASLWSLVGGLLVVGLYAEVTYLQGIGVFTGVKLAYLVPLLVASFVAISRVSGRAQTMAEWWGEVRPRLETVLRSPVSWGGAVAIVVVLAAVALALMRSGNESAVAPSGLELRMRTLLETALIARPRTKEFLIGHPALVLALALACMRRRTWLPLVVLVGAFGQISLLNTFCHFHIPLSLSLLRSFHGVWIGALFGLLFVLLWRLLVGRPERVAA